MRLSNGPGKTTTLRLVLGLLRKKQGAISLFGKSFDRDRVSILRRVGSLIETPSLYGHLTAVENLTLLQKIYRCPKQRIREVRGVLIPVSETYKKRFLGLIRRLE